MLSFSFSLTTTLLISFDSSSSGTKMFQFPLFFHLLFCMLSLSGFSVYFLILRILFVLSLSQCLTPAFVVFYHSTRYIPFSFFPFYKSYVQVKRLELLITAWKAIVIPISPNLLRLTRHHICLSYAVSGTT